MSMNINLVEGDTKNDKQSKLILQIKKFAKENQCHIILVAHPRKSSSFLRKTDISGTADLTNAVDDVFIIHRVNNDFFRAGAEYFGQSEIQRFQGYGNVIEVCKDRMWGVVDLMVGVYYELESRRFKNSAIEDMRYGWEAEPVQQAMNFTASQPQPQVQVQQVFTPDEPFPQSDTDEAPF